MRILKKILKWGAIGFIALIVIGSIGAALGGSDKNSTSQNNSSQTQTSNQPQEQEVAKEPEMITAQQLADAFDANQVAAEKEWGGKYVQFSAEISNITDSGLSFTNVGSKEFSFTQISCRVSDKNQLLSVKNGEVVSVKGTVGSQTIGVIDVKDCEIVK